MIYFVTQKAIFYSFSSASSKHGHLCLTKTRHVYYYIYEKKCLPFILIQLRGHPRYSNISFYIGELNIQSHICLHMFKRNLYNEEKLLFNVTYLLFEKQSKILQKKLEKSKGTLVAGSVNPLMITIFYN